MMLNPALFVPAQISLSSGTSVLTRPMNAYFSPWNHRMSFVLWLVSRCFIITGLPSALTFPLTITDVQQNAGIEYARANNRTKNFFIINYLPSFPA